MSLRTELGKITGAQFGWGGYQDAMLGVSWGLGGNSWGVSDFWGTWGQKRTERTQWTEEERIAILAETCMRLSAVLTKAKKRDVSALVGVPIEATFEGNLLKSWRVLEEVL